MEQNKDFLFYCDKFIEHAIKYSYKEQQQIQLEKLAYQKGVLSKQNFLKLKNARQNTMLSLNKIAYNFKKACDIVKSNTDSKDQIYKLLKDMVQVYDIVNK